MLFLLLMLAGAGDELEVIKRGIMEMADALVITGHSTGADTDPALLDAAREAVPDTPVLIGSGLSEENLVTLASRADGAIVGTAVKFSGITTEPVDPERAERLASEASELTARLLERHPRLPAAQRGRATLVRETTRGGSLRFLRQGGCTIIDG